MQVLYEILKPVYSARVAALLFGLLDTTQFQSRPPLRLPRYHAFRKVLLGCSFEVVAQLVVQFLIHLCLSKQRPQPQWNREQPVLRSHYSSLSVSDARDSGSLELDHPRNGTRKPAPVVSFLFELPPAEPRQRIVFGPPAVLGCFPLGRNPALLLQLVKGRV